jgi:Ni,Fe-hydrogenase I cytochrome b subunit
MEKHINVIAALRIGLSVFGLIIGAVLVTILYFIGDFVDDKDAAMVLTIIANVFIVLFFVLSIPGIIAGIGLFKRKEWARILTLILSVLDLFNIPIGTALGIYSIWALVQPEVVEQFKMNNQ